MTDSSHNHGHPTTDPAAALQRDVALAIAEASTPSGAARLVFASAEGVIVRAPDGVIVVRQRPVVSLGGAA